jgi:hypothetical protein
MSGTTSASMSTMAMRRANSAARVVGCGIRLYDSGPHASGAAACPTTDPERQTQGEASCSVTPATLRRQSAGGQQLVGPGSNNRLTGRSPRGSTTASDRDQVFFRYTHGVRDAFAQSASP